MWFYLCWRDSGGYCICERINGGDKFINACSQSHLNRHSLGPGLCLGFWKTKELPVLRCVLLSSQVIKYKLCRCVKKKHKGRNGNDRGAVLSLDDVKRHVSALLLRTFTVSQSVVLSLDRDSRHFSLVCFHLICCRSGECREEGIKSHTIS